MTSAKAKPRIEAMDAKLAERLAAARAARGQTLDELAEASGVSRAMISKIERGESSPTAMVLGRLAAGLDVSLSSLFAEVEGPVEPLARADRQPVWRDPETGYIRRNVAPPVPAPPRRSSGSSCRRARAWPIRPPPTPSATITSCCSPGGSASPTAPASSTWRPATASGCRRSPTAGTSIPARPRPEIPGDDRAPRRLREERVSRPLVRLEPASRARIGHNGGPPLELTSNALLWRRASRRRGRRRPARSRSGAWNRPRASASPTANSPAY